jgi:hypothetical protein
MRTPVLALILALALAGVSSTASAKGHHHHATTTSAPGDDYYTNVSGHRVHRPVHASSAPSGASAHCGDGSYSFSEHHQGTCSHHGGVSTWLH